MPETTQQQPFGAFITVRAVAFARRYGAEWEVTFDGPPVMRMDDRLFSRLFRPAAPADLRPGLATTWVPPTLDEVAEGTRGVDRGMTSAGAIRSAPSENGNVVPAAPRHGGSEPQYDWARGRALFEAGKSGREIAQILGCHETTVSARKKQEGWQRKARAALPHAMPCPRCQLKTTTVPCEYCQQSHPELEQMVR